MTWALVTPPMLRGRFYYGWYIVGLAFLSQFLSAGVQGYGMGFFLKPMAADLGLSRGQMSLVRTASVALSAVISFFVVGPFIDRRGGRGLMIVGTVVAGAGVALLSLSQSIWHLLLFQGVIGTIGFLLMGNLVVNVAVANWFIRLRGRAVAFGSFITAYALATIAVSLTQQPQRQAVVAKAAGPSPG